MNRRPDLQKLLTLVLGSPNVYFQPPSTVTMKYPCIVYARSRISGKRANNNLYNNRIGYMVTLITKDPDDLTFERLLNLPLCRFNSHYTAENLNHDVFTLFY